MSRLIWDADNDRSFEYGVSRGVLYVKMDARDEAAGTDYYPGVAWNGLTNITIEREGFDSTRLDSSGFVYDILRSPETLAGSIEAYTYPEDFNECDGTKHFTNGGMVGQQEHVPFGLCYRTELANNAYLIHVIYDCTAILGEGDDETVNETIEAKLFHWDFDTFPYQMDGYSPFSELLFDSRNIPADKMLLLENCLYGSGSNDPTLPIPENLLSLVYNGEYVPPSRKDLIRIYPLNVSLNGTYDAPDNIAYKPVIVDVGSQDYSNAVIYEDYHEEYAVETEGELLCCLADRRYYKTNSELAFGAIFYRNGFTHVLLVSTDPDAVSFTTLGNTFTYEYTMEYLGVTWYISSGKYAMGGKCSNTEGVLTFLRPNDKYFDFVVYAEDGDGGARYASKELLDKALNGFVGYLKAYRLSDTSQSLIKPPEGYSGFAPIILDEGIVRATSLSVFSNGTYLAESGYAYAPVVVSVPQTEIDSLNVTSNGTYSPPSGHAYGTVFVNVSGQLSNVDRARVYDSVEENYKYIYVNPAYISYCKVDNAIFPYTIEEIFMPECITIGSDSFSDYEDLSTVSFPECTSIEECAFEYCHSLASMYFPKCENIGAYAFAYCYSLSSICFSACTSVGDNAFWYCENLSHASFSACSIIGEYAFAECSALTSVYFPVCASIGRYAFDDCYSLVSVSFPECTNIDCDAFTHCYSLASVHLSKCESICTGAFADCHELVSLYLLGSSVCDLASTDAFYSTPISDYIDITGDYGSIFVPTSLVDAYKSATNWSEYFLRFVGV